MDVRNKLASSDRVLVLEVIDGQKPLSSTGLVDPRLFTGENKLHAIKDTQTCLWHLKYDQGIVPPPLKGQYTGFNQLKKFCEDYFQKRNMRIKEVID
jgi:hypothetical protein